MTESEKWDTWTSFHAPDPLMGTGPVETTRSAVPELLEDPGNCRQYIDPERSLYLLSESLVSEQQKLRDVLTWAEGVLQGPTEACNEFCSVEYFPLAHVKHAEKEQIPPAYELSLGAKRQQPIRPTASNDEANVTMDSEVCQPSSPNYKNKSKEKNCVGGHKPLFRCDPLLPSSCSPVEYEETWLESKETEDMKSMKLQHTNNKHTLRQVNCSTSRPHVSNQRHHKETSDCNSVQTLASDSATHVFKESSAVFGAVRSLQPLYDSSEFTDTHLEAAGAYSQKKMSDNQQEQMEIERMETCEELKLNCKVKERQKHQESSSDSATYTYDRINDREKEKRPEWRSKSTNLSFTLNMKLPSHLKVCEQYQLCVDLLHQHRLSQHAKPRNLPPPVEKPSASATLQLSCHVTNPENKTHSDDISDRAAESTEERLSHLLSEDLDTSQHNKDPAAPSENVATECCETDAVNEAPVATEAGGRRMNLDGKQPDDLLKESADDSLSYDAVINTPDETLWRQHEDFEASACTAKPGRLLKKKSPPLSRGDRQRDAKAPQRTTGAGVRRRVCEGSINILTDRPLPSSNQNTIKYSKKLRSCKGTKTPGSRVKHTSFDGDTHRIQQTTATHTLQQEPTRPSEGATECVSVNNNGCQNRPAGVRVCDRWMCLPDEVWLSILSLVPHRDLCRVLQVCHRLRTLANDHTLWRNLKIEKSSVNDQWLLCVGRHRPQTLCLYSCSSLSVSSSGLQRLFSLCRNSLQELKVTNCFGAGLHGDQVLTLIGQLCDHVTSVDVSWSGATDSGLKALSDSSKRFTLRSVVLNGCKITDVPLKKLIMKHHESLRRLEVFGCYFLSPSCLQTVFKMCPGLQHLNIGHVPKVNIHSLTVMMSQLKCLISLNLSGLQVVNDASVDSLLQNCVKLQCLSLSSCPAITDLTLHNISKHTPCIRSLGLSGCAAVTDAGIQSLALGCRRLQQLDLSSTRTGNRGVSLLASYCSYHLHTVKLSFCHIASKIILKLCRNCKRLKVLHLYGCVHLPTERQISNVNSTVKVYPPH